MATTPVYDLPYLELDDAPDLAGATADLASAVESELSRIDANVSAINALAPSSAASDTDNIADTATVFAAGSPTVGTSFVAPPSGAVFITVSSYFRENLNGNLGIVSYTVRNGSTVGAGTVVGAAANANVGLIVGQAVNTSAPATLNASHRKLWFGLTPGAAYNVRVEHCTTPAGSITVFYREILVEPSL